MREGAAHVVAAGADAVDINMGCPVPKVRRTGAGVQLLAEPDLAVALAARRSRRRRRRAGHRQAPLRPSARRGLRRAPRAPAGRRGRGGGDRLPPALGRRSPQGRAGLRARGSPGARAAGAPDPHRRHGGRRQRARRLRADGGRGGHARARRPRQPLAVRGARSAPARRRRPRAEVARRAALDGRGRSRVDRRRARLAYLRKFYPWFVARLELGGAPAKALQREMQSAPTTACALDAFEAASAAPAAVGEPHARPLYLRARWGCLASPAPRHQRGKRAQGRNSHPARPSEAPG